MLKQNPQTKAEFFDDAGEIQIVPIDTVIDDGGFDLGADDSCKNRSQCSDARGSQSKDTSRRSAPLWKEPDIVA